MRVVKIEFTSLVADATSLSGFVYLMVSLMEVIMKKNHILNWYVYYLSAYNVHSVEPVDDDRFLFKVCRMSMLGCTI